MKRLNKAIRLTTLCFLGSSLLACGEKPAVKALPIPAERMDCVQMTARPKLPAEHLIDWTRVATIPQARSEHDKFVASVRTREGIVAGYLLDLEGRVFACSSDAQWLREWQKEVAE